MEFSKEQETAFKLVQSWYQKGNKQIFRLFGYAGTGKTTLAKYFAQDIEYVFFAAFTGKAAQVLREKGAKDAKTIHSLIYYQSGEDEDGSDLTQKSSPRFILNKNSKVASSNLIVVDECSMVNEQLGLDLMSFQKPILVLGDPAQLPPPSSCGFFTKEDPDFLLKTIFRQEADNPILSFATDVREGKNWDYGHYGDLKIIPKRELTKDIVLNADQILVGRNKTRDSWNRRLRELKGFKTQLPEIDDKLVCLANDHKKGLLNGSLWRVINTSFSGNEKKLSLYIASEDNEKEKRKIKILKKAFQEPANFISKHEKTGCNDFDFGYALTVHKAQGSQWDNVVLLDESPCFSEHARSWLYTGITRAAKRLIVAR